MKNIPNFFTLLNLVFGCVSIILILQTGESIVTQSDTGTWVPQLPEKIWWGSVFIGLAAIIDFLDGFVARLFKATSEMGKQLDSLADIVSFGVAPGMILYQLLRISYAQEETALDTSVWMLAPALLFPLAGAWRLARFNISDGSGDNFTGVPIPAAGLVVASLPLILLYNEFNIVPLLINKWTLYLIIVILSALMISRRPFLSMKFTGASLKNSSPKFILAGAAIISAIFLRGLAVPVIFIIYIALSLTLKNTSK